ncbi:MAG: LytTR family transcriptional regulator DNA-binding domain-containing protein [Lachnospira sp.]|nr:LytTR family transcriptional regulator DNA-binding domain-containing protein [Lachnospira sp.]
MKYTIRQITEGEDEIIIQYRRMTPDIERILNVINGTNKKLSGWKEKTLTLIDPNTILYIESVDGKVFAYTKEDVLRLDSSLNQLEQLLTDINFFRCSKSMIVNINKVESLKSLPSNRIDASMCNGEHIIISRTYASDFRKRLKRGADNEEN